ncbi:hypothetical protein BJX64DRAFT_268688 [Aspergillus heterothallicus]
MRSVAAGTISPKEVLHPQRSVGKSPYCRLSSVARLKRTTLMIFLSSMTLTILTPPEYLNLPRFCPRLICFA